MSALMNVLTRTLAAFGLASAAYLVVLPLGPAPTCTHQDTFPAARFDQALFGVEMPLPDGEGAVLVETARVPLVPGTLFAWRLHLPEQDGPVHVREELILPEAPAVWNYTDSTRISADRRVAVTEDLVFPEAGWISNGWALTEGDPPGEYVIRIHLDGQLAKTFRFVVDPPSCGCPCGGH